MFPGTYDEGLPSEPCSGAVRANRQCWRTVLFGKAGGSNRSGVACRRRLSKVAIKALVKCGTSRLGSVLFRAQNRANIAFAFFAFVTPFFVEYLHFSTCSALL